MPSKELVWDKNYEMGISKIDKQHQKLFSLVNKLYAIKEENLKEEMRDILYEFRKYMIEHFADEEEYMRGIGFPDLLKHIESHKEIIENISKIMNNSPNVKILKTRLQIMTKRVIVGHIKNEDMQIKLFSASNNNKITEEIFDIPL